MGCEIIVAGVPQFRPLPAAGYFPQDVLLREEAGAYAIHPERGADGRTTLELRLDAADWPSSP